MDEEIETILKGVSWCLLQAIEALKTGSAEAAWPYVWSAAYRVALLQIRMDRNA